MPEEPKPISKMDTAELEAAYQQADRERNMLITKISELQQEAKEHVLVLDAFEKVEPTRRCFRLIGGVLVEQTVSDVKSPLTENQKRLEDYVTKLNEALKEKTDRIESIVARSNKIAKRNAGSSSRELQGNERGVLV